MQWHHDALSLVLKQGDPIDILQHEASRLLRQKCSFYLSEHLISFHEFKAVLLTVQMVNLFRFDLLAQFAYFKSIQLIWVQVLCLVALVLRKSDFTEVADTKHVLLLKTTQV